MPRIEVNKERCKGCGLCVHFCRRQAIQLLAEINSRGFHPAALFEVEKCTGCADCALLCPEACITVYRDEPPSAARGRRLGRQGARR
jgi:2-oxoglutarate ferredoxin oxidoreductase subunit delta